jgi:DNA-binding XRE family transcriptional regulator
LAALVKEHGPLVTVGHAEARTGVHISRLDATRPPGLTRYQVGGRRYVVLADVYAASLALPPRGVDVDGAALREKRRQLGIKLLDVARHIGVTEGAVSRWENGLMRPTPDHARSWQQLLDGVVS